MASLKDFAELAKSGIVTLVVISVLAGYLAGHPFEKSLNILRLFATLSGILLLSASATALNQIQEVAIDAKMPRTQKRPLPSQRLTLRQAKAFTWTSLILGLFILAFLDWRLVILGILAVFLYNVLYTLWWKPKLAYAAIPGAIPGALPILMGYVSASSVVFSPGGFYLFFILFFWQMPHFWSLAIRYQEDYALAGVPTLPVSLGKKITRQHILLWTLGYIALALIAPPFLQVGWIYEAIALATSAIIVLELIRFLKQPDERKAWLRFFLWINFSLTFFLAGIVIDLWSIYLIAPLTR